MYSIRVLVRFADMDALAHVNNAVYHTFLEEARIGLMNSLGIFRDPGKPGIAWILARTEIDFRSPAVYGDALAVTARVGELRNRSFDMFHRITRERDNQLIAEARAVLVCLDYASNKSVQIPEAWREKLGTAAA